MELFSGSGQLSAAMKKRGFSIFPVDHEFNAHKTAVATISLNLQETKNQKLVESMLLQAKPAAIHLGLPCGTCSRARDKPLPAHLKEQFPDPPPLRDAYNLMGFPHLKGTQAIKVQTANDLYEWGGQTALPVLPKRYQSLHRKPGAELAMGSACTFGSSIQRPTFSGMV